MNTLKNKGLITNLELVANCISVNFYTFFRAFIHFWIAKKLELTCPNYGSYCHKFSWGELCCHTHSGSGKMESDIQFILAGFST